MTGLFQMPTLAIESGVLVFLFLWSAFFSATETAFFSLDPVRLHRIKRTRPRASEKIEGILAAPTKLLSTILIGNTLVNVCVASLGYAVIDKLVPAYEEFVSISLVAFLLMILGEVAPKRFAIRHAEQLAVHSASLVRALIALFCPMRVVVEAATRLFRRQFRQRSGTLTESEFLTAVDVSEKEGELAEEERTMVDGIIRLENSRASDVMTPRVDLVGLGLNDTAAAHDTVIRNTRFRYLPLYRGTMDHIEGFVDVSKYLLGTDRQIAAATIPPFHVPETAPLDMLLAEFQREHRRIAVVADEYGGTAGIITRGDILEEIVDYVGDERDERKRCFEPSGRNRWLVDGTTSLEEVNYRLELNLNAEGADRLAGWVTAVAERIPKVGDVIAAQNCQIIVVRVKKHRVTLVEIEKLREYVPPWEIQSR
jgi:putative hemolysin